MKTPNGLDSCVERVIFEDANSDMFYVVGHPHRAVYVTGVRELPYAYKLAPSGSAHEFWKAHKLAWDLVQIHLPYLRLMACRFPEAVRPHLVSDVGVPRILLASLTWDGKRSFITYIHKYLWADYYSAVRGMMRHLELSEEMPSPNSFELEQKDLVLYILNQLDPFERHLLVLRFWHELSLEELGDVLGLGKSGVHFQLAKVLEKCHGIALDSS